jgi:hypothetical protein
MPVLLFFSATAAVSRAKRPLERGETPRPKVRARPPRSARAKRPLERGETPRPKVRAQSRRNATAEDPYATAAVSRAKRRLERGETPRPKVRARYPLACSSKRISSIASAAFSIGRMHVPAPRWPPPP